MKQSEINELILDEEIVSPEEEEEEDSSNYAMDEYLNLLRKVSPMLGEVISPASDIKEAQTGSAKIMQGDILGVSQMIGGLAGILVPGSQYIKKGGQKVSKFLDDKLKGYHATPEENIPLIKEKGFSPTGRKSVDADIGVHVALDSKITDNIKDTRNYKGKKNIYKTLPLNINKDTKALEVNDLSAFRIPSYWNKAFDGIKTNKVIKEDFKKAIDEAEQYRISATRNHKSIYGHIPASFSQVSFWSSNEGKVYWLQKLRELGNKHNFDSFVYNNKFEKGTSDANDSLMLLYPNQVDEILKVKKQGGMVMRSNNYNTQRAI
jgi:hypothetical protein